MVREKELIFFAAVAAWSLEIALVSAFAAPAWNIPLASISRHSSSSSSSSDASRWPLSGLHWHGRFFPVRRPRRCMRLSEGPTDGDEGSNDSGSSSNNRRNSSRKGDESNAGTRREAEGEEERRWTGEWDVEPGEVGISGDELSGLYSRISAMREREVEIDRVCAYNWRKGTCSHDLLFQAADPIQHLRWVEDQLAFGTDGGGTWIISRQTGFVINVFEGHAGGVTALYFDGELLVTGGFDKTVRVQRNSRDCLEKEQLGEVLHVLEGHTERVTGVARLDGRRLASCSVDGSLRVWDMLKGEALHEVKLPSPAFCLGAAEGYLVTGMMDGKVIAWEAKNSERAPTPILSLDAHEGAVTSLSFPKQDVLLTGGGDGRVKYWALNEGGGAVGNRYEIGGETVTHVFKGHSAPVSAVQCDEHRLVSAANDGTVSAWDVRTGEELFQIYGHTEVGGSVTSLQFDREHLVTDGTGESLYLHDFTGRRGAPAVGGDGAGPV